MDDPEELEPVLEPMPVLPDPDVLLSELEPLLGALVPPLEELELWSCRQRSFSAPVRLSHCVLLLPLMEGELLELPLVLGDEELLGDEDDAPPLEEPVLPDPPTLCDDDCAIAAAENANSAATVAVERVFNIVASPLRVEGSGT